MDVGYTEGRGLAVVGERVAVLLPDATDPALAVRLGELVAAGGGLAEVLHAVVAAAPDGLATLPSFAAAALRPDAVRVTVRGTVPVEVHGPAGVTAPDGRDVVTWHEQTIVGGTGCVLGTVDEGEPVLPLVGGVVRAAGLRLGQLGRLGLSELTAAEPQTPIPAPEPPSAIPAPEPPSAIPAPEPPSAIPAPEPPSAGATRTSPSEPVQASAAVPAKPALSDPVPFPDPDLLISDVPGVTLDGRTLMDLDETVPPPAADDAAGSGGAPEAVSAGPTAPGADHVYDHLWGMTQVRRVEDAAVREAESEEHAPATSDEAAAADLNHDGETIGPAALAELRRRRAGTAGADAGDQRQPVAGEVLARLCLAGHSNPPERQQCHECGAPVTGEAVRRARPALGRIRMSDGTLVGLDGSYVLGRKPRVSRVSGGIPRVLTVSSPQGEVSGTHLAVRLEDWHVLAVDLDSSNGSVLHRDGQPPMRLEPQVPVLLRSRDVVDLGDGVVLTFEDLP